MNKVPQISRRKIGAVVIIDLKGELIGPWALHARDDIESLIANSGSAHILINLRDVTTIDSLGVKAVIDNFPHDAKSGIVGGKISVMEMFDRLTDLTKINIFKREEDVIEFFGKDFVKDNTFSPFMEQRKYPRLKTALPLEFWYQDKTGDKITFEAIITDLSEGGLFAEYLDVESLADFNKCFQPQDLKQLHMKVKLPQMEYIYVEGMVTRTVIASEQIGIGVQFLDLREDDRKKIEVFLKS